MSQDANSRFQTPRVARLTPHRCINRTRNNNGPNNFGNCLTTIIGSYNRELGNSTESYIPYCI